MTTTEKLEALLARAVEGGYSGKLPVANDSPSHEWHPYGLIFNHDFARALFGEQEFQGLDAVIASEDAFTGVKRTHYWQCHLQQAVISNDPIDYMHKAVFGDE